jgi:phosphatidylglycerophosphatase A
VAKRTKSEDDAAMTSSPIRWSHPAVVAATCLWLGRIPWAPGTWGAAAGIGLAVVLGRAAEAVGGGAAGVTLVAEFGLLVLVNAVSIPLCTRAAEAMGGKKDPGAINIDEAASMPLALFVLPLANRSWGVMLLAFLLFRFFDILKPFPCRQLERFPLGCGIMADDWGAAVWTGCCLAVISLTGWLPA